MARGSAAGTSWKVLALPVSTFATTFASVSDSCKPDCLRSNRTSCAVAGSGVLYARSSAVPPHPAFRRSHIKNALRAIRPGNRKVIQMAFWQSFSLWMYRAKTLSRGTVFRTSAIFFYRSPQALRDRLNHTLDGPVTAWYLTA